jgi:hypothetical protein
MQINRTILGMPMKQCSECQMTFKAVKFVTRELEKNPSSYWATLDLVRGMKSLTCSPKCAAIRKANLQRSRRHPNSAPAEALLSQK